MEKRKEDQLPSNSERNAKWWYSTFHNVTAMVGAGVLGLPFSMAALGWYISNLNYTYHEIFCKIK